MMDKPIYLFVYGTLRKGFGNHRLLAMEPYATGKTRDNYCMRVNVIPYVTKEPALYPIIGEVYAIDEAMLKRLDHLEQHPRWYCREQIMVETEKGPIEAWIYFMPEGRSSGPIKTQGDFATAVLVSCPNCGGKRFVSMVTTCDECSLEEFAEGCCQVDEEEWDDSFAHFYKCQNCGGFFVLDGRKLVPFKFEEWFKQAS